VLDSARFRLYMLAMSGFTVASFRTQKVTPLEPPTGAGVTFRAFAEGFPDLPIRGIFDPTDFPGESARLRRIAMSSRLLSIARRIAPSRTPPVPGDEAAFLRAVYPWLMAKAWPSAPSAPRRLTTSSDGPAPDLIAELAVDGPFGSFLRAVTDDQGSPTGEYVVDVDWMLCYPTRPGLLAPGGKAYLALRAGQLRTVGLVRGGAEIPISDWRGRQPEIDALLAGMNEELTTIRHNVFVHLATLTSFALASTNTLPLDHPVRRLLHHCFHTVLIGNRELGQIQLGDPRAFAATIFSHDHQAVAQMATDRLHGYDFWDLEPERQFINRGTTDTPFAYPYRDNVLELWNVNLSYVREYLSLYFSDDAWRRDEPIRAWLSEIDSLLPNGIGEWGDGLDWLARLCATVVHVSTVEHDVLNNVTWDYSTLGWLIPTVAPENGNRMDCRRSFDLIATLVVTWKPYNMLLTADVPSLALDAKGRAVMADWIAALALLQKSMERRGHEPSLTYPANFNVSISN
jgi:hypothetical protein